jgi:hypothetical protein
VAASCVSCRLGWCIANRTTVYGLGYKVGPFTQPQNKRPRLSERACARSRGGGKIHLQLVSSFADATHLL